MLLGMVAQAYNPRTWEMEAGGPGVSNKGPRLKEQSYEFYTVVKVK